jgi:hypothetical protein
MGTNHIIDKIETSSNPVLIRLYRVKKDELDGQPFITVFKYLQ